MTVEVEKHIMMDGDLESVSSVCNCAIFEIHCKPESIVMSAFTTSDCVTVDVTMVFLCPFLGRKEGGLQ